MAMAASAIRPTASPSSPYGVSMRSSNSFKLDVENRIQSAEQDGWTITYRKMTSRWASWSGERQGRIVYGRSIRVCDDGVAAFELEYPQDAKDAFDPVVNNLVQSFKPTSCDG